MGKFTVLPDIRFSFTNHYKSWQSATVSHKILGRSLLPASFSLPTHLFYFLLSSHLSACWWNNREDGKKHLLHYTPRGQKQLINVCLVMNYLARLFRSLLSALSVCRQKAKKKKKQHLKRVNFDENLQIFTEFSWKHASQQITGTHLVVFPWASALLVPSTLQPPICPSSHYLLPPRSLCICKFVPIRVIGSGRMVSLTMTIFISQAGEYRSVA